jgi:uncharacterized membrane protein YdbT with pleckstrin-like domain
MAETPIWKGNSSQWKNAGAYTLTVLAIGAAAVLHASLPPNGKWAWLVAALFVLWSLARYILLKSTSYELTNERLIVISGILTKVTNTIELYRVRDMQTVQPLLLRLLGLENHLLISADATSENLTLDYLPAKLKIGEQLRKAVEDCRERKRVRALDVVTEHGGDHAGDGSHVS